MAGVAIVAAGVSVAAAQVAAPGTVAMNTPSATAIAPSSFATYDNKWQVFGGLMYANHQPGQDLTARSSMGGVEAEATYWLGQSKIKTWGIAADYRFMAGTSQAAPQAKAIAGLDRTLVMEQAFTGGVEYRTPFHNRYVGVDLHAMAGGDYGIFNYGLTHNPSYATLPIASCPAEITAKRPTSVGFYCNHLAPYGYWGASFDFNESRKLAIRLQPDMTFEHFGTETREFFSISLGVMYRFGNPKLAKPTAQ